MRKFDQYEEDILDSYEKGQLISTAPSKVEVNEFKAAAQSTSLKNRRVNIRLSSPDLMDIQARALEDGVPYPTLIASVLHKYVSGRLVETPSHLTMRSTGRTKKLRGGLNG
ncbi:MAG: hypothetical protein ACMV0F_06770 [Trichlorobacter sp.]